MADRLAAHLLDRARGVLGISGIEIGNDDQGAFFCEAQGAGASDPAAAAGDDGHFVTQSVAHHLHSLRLGSARLGSGPVEAAFSLSVSRYMVRDGIAATGDAGRRRVLSGPS
jgi:hypothetical protein